MRSIALSILPALGLAALVSMPGGAMATDDAPVSAHVVVVVSTAPETDSRVRVAATLTNADHRRTIIVDPDDVRIFARRLASSTGYSPLLLGDCDVFQVLGHGDTFTVTTPNGSPQPTPVPTPQPTPEPTATPLPPTTVGPGITTRVGRAYGFGEWALCFGYKKPGRDSFVYAIVTWHYAGDPRKHAVQSPVIKVNVM